jgi:hypothetical protein
MSLHLIACCGLDCTQCPVFVATARDDDQLRRRTAADWSKRYANIIGRTLLRASDMNCRGCRAATEHVFVGCAHCDIRTCCKQRSLATCAECPEFEGCGQLRGFFGLHPQAQATLIRLRAGA